MQFSSIIAVLSFALAATALPAENMERNTTPGQAAQNQCSQGQKASCCNQVVKQLINLIPISVGIDCTTIDVLSVLPITSQCSQQQTLACCSSGEQNGLVNVGNVCPSLIVL